MNMSKLLVLVERSARIFGYRSLKGTVTTLTLAPVFAANSLAWRWSGSAICGPVNVTAVISTPAKSPLPPAAGAAVAASVVGAGASVAAGAVVAAGAAVASGAL